MKTIVLLAAVIWIGGGVIMYRRHPRTETQDRVKLAAAWPTLVLTEEGRREIVDTIRKRN